MAELSPARETASPAPRPADETTPLITTSTAATADDGNTPLLATSTSTGQTTPANFAFASTAVKTLTILTLTFSAATLVFMGVTVLICQFVPARHYLPYLVSDAFPALTFWSIISICISSFNIARQRSNRISAPLIINLLFDIIISFNIVDFSLQGLLAFGYPYNMCPWPEDDRPACMKQGLPIRVFAALALGTALSTG
ncbi:hypothetical protein MMC26_002068 [Xylographa opegraphella]|nr:hypothetical protein [Xylographa opegraphella]